MWRIETSRELGDDDFKAVSILLETAQSHDGSPPLSDHLLLALAHRGGPGFAVVMAFDASDQLVGYAQLARANNTTVIELVITPSERDEVESSASRLLRSALEVVTSEGGGTVNWWVHRPGDRTEAIAAEVGLRLGRRLLQMRRSLPIHETTTVDTRSFVVGRDEQEWLRVNNAAFHDHPEQGGWTLDTLRDRQAEPWFDPEGFRLHERDGKLAAFCWTKVHADESPPMGEIYVIAVDPQFHGLGLGKALTIAGLEHLGKQGLTVGMLHVDGANTAALGMYERLGFTVHHADHAYVANTTTTTSGTDTTGAHP
ncbi:MAG: mycothiol synthase [Ilumatobacteraceae bacterium]